jgi:cation transport ATPase
MAASIQTFEVPINAMDCPAWIRTLAAFGSLPPALAAAAQSMPNIGILANSLRLILQK